MLTIPVAVAAAGLAIAVPASMASSRPAADSMPVRSDGPELRISATPARAAADPGARRPTTPGTGCAVSYTAANWPGAFMAKVTISNKGRASINGWTLAFRFPGDEAVSSAWNAAFTQTGTQVVAKNMSYDAAIPRDASQSLGFLGAWTSNAAAPATFSVNGRVCG
jgi:hypothetical protein